MIKNEKIQILRALAIIGVILIHTTPSGSFQIYCRPFVNYAVGLFLFLSGYLTKIENDNWSLFCKKRTARVLIPYVIWTIFYTWESGDFTVIRLTKNLLLTGGCFTFYYIFVYIQFILLTPLIGRLAKSRFRLIGWFIAPCTIILYQVYDILADVHDYVALLYSLSFLGWFSFYYLGILLGNRIISIKFRFVNLLILYCISIALQMVEGYGWFLWGDANCGSQLKISALLSTTLFLLISFKYLQSNYDIKSSRYLILIGDYSFGIYLCHIAVIRFLRNYLPYYSSLPYIANSFIVLCVSVGLIAIVSRILGPKVSKWIGFA